MAMSLAFSASQQLTIPVAEKVECLPAYLAQERRVVQALLNPEQLDLLDNGQYRYAVTKVHVFNLHIHPVVDIKACRQPGELLLESSECVLDGIGLTDDLSFKLKAWLKASKIGLEGKATLSMQVSQPTLLKLIPVRVLEATGHSVLNGILLGLKARVRVQLLQDFQQWCQLSGGNCDDAED